MFFTKNELPHNSTWYFNQLLFTSTSDDCPFSFQWGKTICHSIWWISRYWVLRFPVVCFKQQFPMQVLSDYSIHPPHVLQVLYDHLLSNCVNISLSSLTNILYLMNAVTKNIILIISLIWYLCKSGCYSNLK